MDVTGASKERRCGCLAEGGDRVCNNHRVAVVVEDVLYCPFMCVYVRAYVCMYE